MRTRAERRHHAHRVKNKFLKAMKGWGMSPDWTYWYCTRNYNNRKACSCWMCTNPRKIFKGKERITMQERKIAGSSNGRIVGS